MPDTIANFSVREISLLYRRKKLSPVEVVESCFKQIIKYNPALNALCLFDESQALRAARASERRWMAGTALGPLDGIPATVKDWFHVKGWPTRYGSAVSGSIKQPEDSPPVARLREAGAIFIGKTTLPEYGHKGVTDSPLTGITRNPWNMQKTCGGSSGGAAVAAATGMAFLNIGSDGGGSLRIPASFCGVFGFKPSPGIVPSWPPSLFSTLSAVGGITRRVDDMALLLDALTVPDTRDWHALPVPPPKFTRKINAALPKLRIGFAPSINGTTSSPEMAEVMKGACKSLTALGTVEEINLRCPHVVSVFNTHWAAAAFYLAENFGAKDRKKMDARFLCWIEKGNALTLHDYLRAERERMTIGEYFKSLTDSYDIIVTPTTAIPAFDAGKNMPADAGGKPWEDWTPFTYPANLAKLPAASLPAGMTKDGLPVGLQIMAGFLKDALVLQTAKRLEEALAFKPWLLAN